MSEKKPVTFAILGCGSRGTTFSNWIAKHPDDAKVVAVADPNPLRRNTIGDRHGVASDMRFENWQALLEKPRLAVALVNSTMDQEHYPSTIKALALGYHMMLEKPMAVTIEDYIEIDRAKQKADRFVVLCHSLRYLPVYQKVREIIASGEIGQVVSIDQMEGVEPIHQSHSFVRGNFGNESRATFMLLAKSCHDLDVISFLMNRDVTRVSSFGKLTFFTKANQPAGAPHRCTDGCPVEETCPYYAPRVYGGKTPCFWETEGGEISGWGQYIMPKGATKAQMLNVLQTTRWGECVFDTDNDVVDHQVVNMEFVDGATGTFTMTAFAPGGRMLRVNATKGYLTATVDAGRIELVNFGQAQRTNRTIDIHHETGEHGGADARVIASLVEAIQENDPTKILTSTDVSLKSHAIVFAAERSRREKRMVELSEMHAGG